MEGEISDHNDEYHESKEDLTSASGSESVDEDQGRKHQNRVRNRPPAMTAAATISSSGQERPPLWSSSSSNLNSKFSVWKDNPGSIQDRRQRFFQQTGFKNLRGEQQQRFGHRSGGSLSKSVSAPELETKNSVVERSLAVGKESFPKHGRRIMAAPAENGVRKCEGAHKNGAGSPEFELSMIEQLAVSNGAVIRKRSLSDQLLAKKGDTKAFAVSFLGPSQYSAEESFCQGSQDLAEQNRVDSRDGVSVITPEGSPSHGEVGSRTQKSYKSSPSPLHKGSRVWSNSSQELEPMHQHQPSSSFDEFTDVFQACDGDHRVDTISGNGISMQDEGMKGVVYRIRDLDSGKEFVVDEFGTDGTLEKFKDVDTGKELTLEEFESSLGLYPVMQELKRREREADRHLGDIESGQGSQAGHVVAKKKGWLGNIKGALLLRDSRDKSAKQRDRGYRSRNFDRESSSKVLQDKEGSSKGSHDAQGSQIAGDHRDGSSRGGLHSGSATEGNSESASTWQWPQRIKVRSRRKSCKQLSELHLGQKIEAHQGAIWTMKFSCDGHYLASAGQDQVVCVWEIVDHPLIVDSDGCGRGGIIENGRSEAVLGWKSGKTSSVKRKSADLNNKGPHAKLFWLSNKAMRSFHGHTAGVLDLSWSHTQVLLSSSMDKTVRMWHMSYEGCLRVFSHNDYVTCIQFNPVDEHYFLSGAFDDKVRIWSIPDHHVVDWTDLGERVTALCYTPDGKRAIVGSYKGTCRYFNTTGNRLQLESHIDVRNDRNRKSRGRKITGLQCMPGNPSKVLVTSNDSCIRVYDQLEMISEYRGLRNVNSQISGSFCGNGELILSASEHSRVYMWNSGILHPSTKSVWKDRKQSCEEFYCHNVSVAIPWPGVSPGLSLSAPGSETPGRSMQSGSEVFVSPSRDDTQNVNELPPFDERGKSSLRDEIVGNQNSSLREECLPAPVQLGPQCSAAFSSSSALSLPINDMSNSKQVGEGLVNLPKEAKVEIPGPEVGKLDFPDSALLGFDAMNLTQANPTILPASESVDFLLENVSKRSLGDEKHINSGSQSASESGSGRTASERSITSRQIIAEAITVGDSLPVVDAGWGLVIVTGSLGGQITIFHNYGLPIRL